VSSHLHLLLDITLLSRKAAAGTRRRHPMDGMGLGLAIKGIAPLPPLNDTVITKPNQTKPNAGESSESPSRSPPVRLSSSSIPFKITVALQRG
jgi:hypothetical protein